MEDAETISRSADAAAVNKKRATPTSSLPASSSVNGSNNKRQRLGSKTPTKEKSSAVDFISLDFSEGDGEGKEESETITRISKSAPSDAIVEEGEDAEEEEEEVKKKMPRRRRRARVVKKRKDKELDTQGVQVEEQPGQLNLTSRGDSSDEESGIKTLSKKDHSDPKDAENESEEEEDKDSSTRRALQAKMSNGTQIPEEGQVERNFKAVESAVVTVAEPEADNANLNNSPCLSIEVPKDGKLVTEDGAEISARQKVKEKKEKRRREGGRRGKATRKERRDKAQLDLPKGGDFSNLEGSEVIGISSDENDDEGLEINVDMDIVDFEEQQENQPDGGEAGLKPKNKSDDEEGEVDENDDGVSEEEIESSGDDGDDKNDDGDDTPLLDQTTAVNQRKYYTAFILPPFEHEEARPYFSAIKNPDFKIDLIREKEVSTRHKIKESKRICNVCTKTGHTEDECELIKCKHCEKWNEHFSHACPDAPSESERSRVKDLWRRIPTHRHKNTPLLKLRVACYYCAGTDHFGDDCPRVPPLSVPGSFSLTDINTCGYASQEWLLKFSDKLDDLESGKTTVKCGPAGTKENIMPAPDPFKDLRRIDETPKNRVPERNGGGGKDNDNTYRPNRAPRGAPRAPHQYRAHSPIRSEVFDRYRELPRPHGLPPRPRSRSPPRHRGGEGPLSWNRSSDYHDRPTHGGGRGVYGSGPGRAYESRAQPPLPNEVPPRGGGDRGGGGGGGARENYRPMPSSAKENWRRYKT